MSTRRHKYAGIPTALVLSLAGCATTPDQQGQPQGGMSDTQRTRAEGAVAGAVLGGLLGYVLGKDSKDAAIGAVVGAGAGYLIGNEIAKRKQQYSTEESFLDGEIQRAAEFNRTARQYNDQLIAETMELDRTSQELTARYDRGLASRSELQAKKADVQRKMKESNEVYENLKQEYDIKVAVYQEQQNRRGPGDAYLVRLESEIRELEANLEDLRSGSVQLASIDDRLTR